MESEKKKPDYKDTLNLPKTDFSMRAGLLRKEPEIQARWQAEDLYGTIRRERAGAERFVLHDGPCNQSIGTDQSRYLSSDVLV